MARAYPRISPVQARWTIIVVFIAILEAITRTGLVRKSILIPPTEMARTLIILVLSGEVTAHFARTMIEIFVSFTIAAVLGMAVGMIFWRFSRVGKMFEPYIISLYALPMVMFYPILLIFLGLGSLPVIFITVMASTIPIILNTTIGFAEIREVLYKVARSNNCTRWQTFSKVMFPAATPFVFTGLKQGFVYALIVTVAMEFVLTDLGLGFQVHQAYQFFKTTPMYAYILLNLLIAVVANYLLFRCEEHIRREV